MKYNYIPPDRYKPSWSLPSWERGLKYVREGAKEVSEQSLPSWERGLKSVGGE